MINLFKEIDQAILEIGNGWTSASKGQTMAAIIIALKPAISVEVGCWYGKGLISMALAHKAISYGVVIGVDPYSSIASEAGQVNEADKEFWMRVNHDTAYHTCLGNINKFGVREFARIERVTSDQFEVPENCTFLRLDSNHGMQAFKDAQRYASRMKPGSIFMLDDLNWAGGGPQRALNWMLSMGWVKLYHLDDGAVLQKIR